MITEKDLEKTKFFTTDGSDILEVTKTQTIEQIFLTDLKTRREYCCQVGCETSRMFEPIVMPKVRGKGSHRGTKAQRDKGDKENRELKKPTGQPRRATKYKGVYPGRTTVKGQRRWHANLTVKGKTIHLGSSFESEELAAAAVQEYLGNKAEAQKLRDLAEQAEVNIDRPTGKRHKAKPRRPDPGIHSNDKAIV